jgi:hypothetical protein
MDRVETCRVGDHRVAVVESVDDDGSWFHLVLDGVESPDVWTKRPGVEELQRAVRAGPSR